MSAVAYGVDDLVRMARISYRQADHWTRRGWIVASADGVGSGYRRTWSADEVAVAVYMATLVRAGVTPAAAARAARNGGLLSAGVRVLRH